MLALTPRAAGAGAGPPAGGAGGCACARGRLLPQDFLSAVEDAENQFVVPGRLSPVPSSAPSPAADPRPLRPLAAQLGHQPGKAPGLRPLAGQREQPTGCWGPPARGAAPQDELDNDLFLAACMELEGPELLAGAAPLPPARWEQPPRIRLGQESLQEAPKKLRVGEELVSRGSGGLKDRQDPLPTPQAAPTPKLVLRPSAAGAGPPLPLGKPGSSWGSVPTPGGPTPRPFQVSPCQPGASNSSVGLRVPQTPLAQAPRQSCPPPRLPPRLPPNPPTLMSCVEPPPRQPPPPAPGNLQTPVVTNHLVQLVTAASEAPRAAPQLPPRGKTRRFPGPAGILPQQVGAGDGMGWDGAGAAGEEMPNLDLCLSPISVLGSCRRRFSFLLPTLQLTGLWRSHGRR